MSNTYGPAITENLAHRLESGKVYQLGELSGDGSVDWLYGADWDGNALMGSIAERGWPRGCVLREVLD